MTLDELDAAYAAMTQGPLVVGEWTAYDSKAAESYHLYIEKKHGAHVASWLTKPNASGIVALHNHYPALRGLLRCAVDLLEQWRFADTHLSLEDATEAFLAACDKPLPEATANG